VTASPNTKAFVYRNMIKALPWFTSVRKKITDPAYAPWFMNFSKEVVADHTKVPCTSTCISNTVLVLHCTRSSSSSTVLTVLYCTHCSVPTRRMFQYATTTSSHQSAPTSTTISPRPQATQKVMVIVSVALYLYTPYSLHASSQKGDGNCAAPGCDVGEGLPVGEYSE
jgi:hypothetical protein